LIYLSDHPWQERAQEEQTAENVQSGIQIWQNDGRVITILPPLRPRTTGVQQPLQQPVQNLGQWIIHYRFKNATSLERVTLPALVARFFTIHINDDDAPWESSELISPEIQDRTEVWEQLNRERALPHWSQFIFTDQDRNEIQQSVQKWPSGAIYGARLKFPVTWLVEGFSAPIVQSGLTTEFTAETAWQRPRATRNDLFKFMAFNYAGFLKPDHVITAEIRRGVEIDVTVRFEAHDRDHRGFINYEGFKFSNMAERPVIHEFFCMLDTRIPPYNEHIDVEDRPYAEFGTINFNLQNGIPISDLSSNSPAAAGGDNGHGFNLPPIIAVENPAAPVDLSSGTKVQGASAAPIVTQSMDDPDSESTESEDEPLFRITQSIHRGEPVQDNTINPRIPEH
jgi:hypothetical protein